jgi:hypothetical protein
MRYPVEDGNFLAIIVKVKPGKHENGRKVKLTEKSNVAITFVKMVRFFVDRICARLVQ